MQGIAPGASKDDGVGIYVYMLRCADGSFYIGSATGEDTSQRVDQHNAGAYPGYTHSRRPVALVTGSGGPLLYVMTSSHQLGKQIRIDVAA